MSTALERLRGFLHDKQLGKQYLHTLSASERMGRECLEAIDALIAERDAAKARAEKAEAELTEADKNAEEDRKEIEVQRKGIGKLYDLLKQAEAGRDALRKALEQIKPLVEPRIMFEDTRKSWPSLSHKQIDEIIDAALHGTAKQEPFPSISRHSDTGECLDSNVVPQEPKPRTCGECADYESCRGKALWHPDSTQVYRDDHACADFLPRADAQKGGAR